MTEPLPVVVRAAETVEGRGRLYRRGRARDTAAESLRAVRRSGRLGRCSACRPAPRRGTVVDAVAARAGRPPARGGAAPVRCRTCRRRRAGAPRRRPRRPRPGGPPTVTDAVDRPARPTRPPADALRALQAVRTEVAKAVVGQDAAVTGLVIALLCRGHVLLEGVPGVAKTLLVARPGRGAVAGHQAGAVHARPDARRRHRLAGLRRAQRRRSRSARARSSPTCCSPTRSTGRRPRRRRRCSRRWRSGRSPSTARAARCPTRSSWSPRRTRSSTRARTRCPRPSSTASCSS